MWRAVHQRRHQRLHVIHIYNTYLSREHTRIIHKTVTHIYIHYVNIYANTRTLQEDRMRYPAVRLVALLSSLSTTSLNNCSTILLIDVCNMSNISLFKPSLLVSPSLPSVYDIIYYIMYTLLCYVMLLYVYYIIVHTYIYIYYVYIYITILCIYTYT